ncbi:nucleoside diphosphate kinase regulator [Stenotrophomonas sp. ATCM1_4]|jgi:regulator of nucleoside diphosphate kinase|uniref:Nucleoside diphosphate kinase regulator n=1 Tax=Stenotrophomonas capsici TaxID=3110230 RepID=A0ABU5V1M3_9GAMM|nr:MULTISPECIES: nucleoside diphosphate kinase regulator [unclassified Stenotrophomonas]MBD9535383.1 nucleoside diphosphate kinase regulator [Stenotrophomonas sp. STM01]MEA5667255.1 nucleoside diphosphate kinase regulator [Stenotrophomonas sp. MH1]TDB28488.1 nucleoside diphosphate kinase regulator [Stenotrophomonas sp. ATCM1_4]
MTSHSGLPPSIIVSTRDMARLEALLDSPALSRHPAAVALSQELERAQVLPPEEIPAGIVTMHSRVDCEDELHDEKHSLTLVYPHEADFDKGRVSVLAPVGSALLGLSVGQTIDWTAPGGRQLRLRVIAVHYQPEAAGDFHR